MMASFRRAPSSPRRVRYWPGDCGQACADGYAVLVNDLKQERAEAVADEIRAASGRAKGLAGDVSSEADVTAFIKRRLRLRAVTLLVNNAGIAHQAFFGFERRAFRPDVFSACARHFFDDAGGAAFHAVAGRASSSTSPRSSGRSAAFSSCIIRRQGGDHRHDQGAGARGFPRVACASMRLRRGRSIAAVMELSEDWRARQTGRTPAWPLWRAGGGGGHGVFPRSDEASLFVLGRRWGRIPAM